MEKKLKKGMYGFHSKKQRQEIIKTIILFAIALAVYFTGLIHTGTNKNLLSIVAIVGVLPASKSAVSMLMFLRYRSAASGIHEQIVKLGSFFKESYAADEAGQPGGIVLYDLIFVLNEKTVKTDCIAICGTQVAVYASKITIKESELCKQLKKFLSCHGKGSCQVNVCSSEKAFLQKLKSYISAEQPEATESNSIKIMEMLLGFSM